MTPTLVLLHRACMHRAEAGYIVPRLALDRKPIDRADRLEVEMWRALGPVLAKHGGTPPRVRAEAPARWAFYLDLAFVLPDWFVTRAEPTPDLVARWNQKGSRGWELPRATPLGVRYDPALVAREAA